MLSSVQNFACGRGYLRAADVSSFCTLADGVGVQMIYCTDNARLLSRARPVRCSALDKVCTTRAGHHLRQYVIAASAYALILKKLGENAGIFRKTILKPVFVIHTKIDRSALRTFRNVE